MKKLKLTGLVAGIALFAAACSSNKTEETTDTSKTDAMAMDTNAMGGTTTDTLTANFMKKAAIGGMMEVEAGKAAAANASAQQVKDFAALMVKDHSMAGDELKALAASKKVTLPDALPEAEQMHLTEMKKMTGSAFDMHYVDMMVNDHAKTVALFKDATRSNDPDVKSWAEKTLKVIEGHYELAKKIKGK